MEVPATQPISIAEAICTLEGQIANIRVKNATMIGWYIHPSPTPSVVAAYEPRINVLARQVRAIDSIHIPNLTLLINDGSSCIAQDLHAIASQLSAAVDGFQTIFIQHYDRTISEGVPYLTIFQTLKYLESHLVHFIKYHRDENPYRRPAESIHPQNPPPNIPTFCKTSIAFLNNLDRGTITTCLPMDLDSPSRTRLATKGGLYFWWECPDCAFRLRVHISNSAHASINETDETRSHAHLPELEYRSSFLAKSHLFHFGREEQTLERERRRRSGLQSSPGQQQRHRRSTSSPSIPINTYGAQGFKYGCIICFAAGEDLSRSTCFRHARDYAEHLAARHGVADLPPSLILENFKIGVRGMVGRDVRRWDLNVT